IAAEEGKLQNDIIAYENAMAIVETAGKPGVIQIGELLRTGDVWKLTQVPQPIEGNGTRVMAGGGLMQPSLAGPTAPGADMPAPSPAVQKLLAELQKLDQAAPGAGSTVAQLANYNARRADLLDQLVSSSSTDEERNQWSRQMIDSIASAVQLGA